MAGQRNPRARALTLTLLTLAAGGCHADSPAATHPSTSASAAPAAPTTPATAAPATSALATSAPATSRGEAARVEPMRLPFDDFAPSPAADPYVYTRSFPSGCALTYQRWWGVPPDPGQPVALESVRSARLLGAAGYALVYDAGEGESRVWRRGEGHQVALDFVRCDAGEVDAVLARSEALTTAPLGTELPAAERVCVGARVAATMLTATPSRAGVFDPAMPIVGEHLNWMAPGVGCVTYPALSTRIACGDGRYPWVATTLCQQ